MKGIDEGPYNMDEVLSHISIIEEVQSPRGFDEWHAKV